MEVTYTTQRLDHPGIAAGIWDGIDLVGHIDRLVPVPRRLMSVGQGVKALILNAPGLVGQPFYLTTEFFFVHLDFSSFRVHGEYDREVEEAPDVIRVTQADLKQAVVALITTYRSALPTRIQASDGNTTDTQAAPHMVRAYTRQLSEKGGSYFVVDSALYWAENLRTPADLRWMTRVPKRLAPVQHLETVIEVAAMQESSLPGYRYLEMGTRYGEVRRCRLVVYSEVAACQNRAASARAIRKGQGKAEQAMHNLARKTFLSEEALSQVVTRMAQKWQYHQVTFTVRPRPHYERESRPWAEATPVRMDWRLVTWRIEPDEGAIVQAHHGPYYGHGSGFVHLCASRTQSAPRTSRSGEAIPGQIGKPTRRLTMQCIFQLFEGIDVVVIRTPQGVRRQVTNLTDLHCCVLHLLGLAVEKYYTGLLQLRNVGRDLCIAG